MEYKQVINYVHFTPLRELRIWWKSVHFRLEFIFEGMLRSLTLSNELCNVMFKANQCLFQYGVSSSAGMSLSLDVTI